jgi:hypothetical protein
MSQTNFRLILGGILLVFLVGDGLILIFMGKQAALTGLLCLLMAMAPVLMTGFVLWLMSWVVERSRRS